MRYQVSSTPPIRAQIEPISASRASSSTLISTLMRVDQVGRRVTRKRGGRPSSRLLRRVVVLNRSSLASEWSDRQLLHPFPRHSPDRTPRTVGCGRVKPRLMRPIEAEALRKLRHPSRSRKLKDYLELRRSRTATAPGHTARRGTP